MNSAKYILWGLVVSLPIVLMILLGPYFMTHARESNDAVKMITLRNAMMITVEGNLELEGGFLSKPRNASEYAETLVERFRLADSLSEEEEAEMRAMGVPIVKINYEIGSEPNGPFEITVEPLDKRREVVIRSWGRDLSTPVTERIVKMLP